MEVCPNCERTDTIFAVEYSHESPEHYDGVSEYWCNPEAGGCGYRQGRWTGFELKKGEAEPRLGQVRVKRNGKWKTEPAGAPVKVG